MKGTVVVSEVKVLYNYVKRGHRDASAFKSVN